MWNKLIDVEWMEVHDLHYGSVYMFQVKYEY